MDFFLKATKQVKNLNWAYLIFPLYTQKENRMVFLLAISENSMQIACGFV